jgi:hypothetical protein
MLQRHEALLSRLSAHAITAHNHLFVPLCLCSIPSRLLARSS